MPPRYSYWTIIAGGLPTAFRAAEREDLMPTFQRLREKHPDAEMKWFARGKLWASPEEARPPRAEHRDRSDAPRDRDRGGFRDRPDRPGGRPEREARGEVRGREWRPGGEHRDPRQQFKDAKKARNQRWRQEKFERKQHFADKPANRSGGPPEHRGRTEDPARGEWSPRPPREKPHGDKFAPRGERSNRFDKQPRGASFEARRDRESRPPREKPHGDKFAPRGERSNRPDTQRRGAPLDRRGEWEARPPREKPHGDKFAPRGERSNRPDTQRRGASPDRRGEWETRPPREKPHGDKFAPRGERSNRPDTQRRGPSFDQRGEREARPPRDNPHGDKVAPRPREGARDGRAPGAPGDWRKDLPRDSWRDTPRERPHGDKLRAATTARPFNRGQRFERRDNRAAGFRQAEGRNQGTNEPPAPPRPRGPNREPRPGDDPAPSAPPRPSEPEVPSPGPPERGRLRNKRRNER